MTDFLYELSAQVLELANSKQRKISTAESCTGGGIAAALTEIPGASSIVDRGFVTYSNTSKFDMLDVSEKTLEKHGAVCEDVAREMAEGALKFSDATLSIAVTGIAGPGGSDHKPEGLVFFALAQETGSTKIERIEFGPIGRSQVRQKTVIHALEMLKEALSH